MDSLCYKCIVMGKKSANLKWDCVTAGVRCWTWVDDLTRFPSNSFSYLVFITECIGFSIAPFCNKFITLKVAVLKLLQTGPSNWACKLRFGVLYFLCLKMQCKLPSIDTPLFITQIKIDPLVDKVCILIRRWGPYLQSCQWGFIMGK